MSGFQIPGLGQAKPNETLPPLPSGNLSAAHLRSEDAVQDQVMEEASAAVAAQLLAPETSSSKPAQAAEPVEPDGTSLETEMHAETPADPAPQAMVVDREDSPPSVTRALEAAIGGLEETAPAQAGAQQSQDQAAESQNDQGEHPEWEMDSSPYESSSESSSSDSSDDDDSENEGYELLGVEETARILMETEEGSDDEGGKNGNLSSAAQLRTKNELPDNVIPKPNVTITPEMKIEELGFVEHVVEKIVLIRGITPGEYQVLDTGSVLCDENRVVLGAVAETIGKVLQPMYTLHLTSEDELEVLGLKNGSKIYYPVDHATYVFTEPLKNVKGSDASNLHDEEVGEEEMEFSDDEKEAEHKRAVKQKRKDKWKQAGGRGGREPHPLRQEMRADGGLNYDDGDDDTDGPYRPLARPPGFGTGSSTAEPLELPPRATTFHRGRRGDRGRSGRGRGSRRGVRGGHAPPRDEGYSLPPQRPPYAAPAPASWNGGRGQPASNLATHLASAPNFPFPVQPQPQPAAQSGQTAGPSMYPPPLCPPPPPGWSPNGHNQETSGGFVNPALFAALLGQMQQAQYGQQQQQQQPPPPPRGPGM